MINAKHKGNRGENLFATWLTNNGIRAFKDSASGGGNIHKGDIVNDVDMNFEVKTVKALNMKKAWDQTVRDSGFNHNTPVLVVHYDGMPKDEWLMVMDNYSWLELVKGNMEIKGQIPPEAKYVFKQLKDNLTKALKYIEQ